MCHVLMLGGTRAVKSKVSMQQIADILEISKVTVSKALSDKAGVGEDLRAKIKAVAAEVGYQLQKQGSESECAYSTIGILVTDVFFEKDENFYSRLYKNLYNSAIAEKVFLTLYKITPEDMDSQTIPEICNCPSLVGLLVLGQISRAYTEFLISLDIPIVLVDFYYQGLKADSVTTDNLYAMYDAVNYLYQRGHRKIGFLGNQRQTSSIQDRYLGYCKSMMEHNLPILPEYTVLEHNDAGEQIEIMLPDEPPTAFVCNSDQAAARLCRKLKQLGFRIPQDVSIIGFDNVSHGTMLEPLITTVNVNRREMAKSAIDTLMRRIKHPEADARSIICRTNIIERESVLTLNETRMDYNEAPINIPHMQG